MNQKTKIQIFLSRHEQIAMGDGRLRIQVEMAPSLFRRSRNKRIDVALWRYAHGLARVALGKSSVDNKIRQHHALVLCNFIAHQY